MSAPFQARYSGWCPVCEKKIEEGDWVQYDRDSGKVIHQHCADED